MYHTNNQSVTYQNYTFFLPSPYLLLTNSFSPPCFLRRYGKEKERRKSVQGGYGILTNCRSGAVHFAGRGNWGGLFGELCPNLLTFADVHETRCTDMIRVFLTGYMGAGKTTLGKALARALGVPFIDLDWYVEERFHKSIPELFAERGESGFRELERNMLHEAGEFEDVVISTGGGTPCFFDNMDYMNAQGLTVFLDVPVEVLFRRLQGATRQRPILRGKTDDELRAFIGEALAGRLPFYSRARYRFDGSRLESRSQIAESVEQLRNLLEI